ncbi:MAG TPA: SWIM zinc finger family protein, partial [Thermomicrobiales bacterium]|nr:SWIM zinc finger family protein [Thermomicrobiales bacterium]
SESSIKGEPHAETPEAYRPLTPEQIASQTDSGSFSRGKTYFRGGRIFAPLRRGPVIQARCRGSSGGPYRVEATLASAGGKRKKNPVAYFCDCPRGGFCKHVVALLLAWIDAPERFEVRPPIAEMLAAKSREELLALVERMVQQAPDLETMIELPMPVAGAPSGEALDEGVLRRQVEAAFSNDGGGRYDYGYGHGYSYGRSSWHEFDEWASFADVAADLRKLVDLADSYTEAGQWRNAIAAYAVIAETTIPHLEEMQDEEGSLLDIVIDCDAGLAKCLETQEWLPEADRLTPAERTRLIDAMLAIWQADVEQGSVGIAEEGPEAIAREATADEKRRVGKLLHAAIDRSAGDEPMRSWRRREAIGFLALLGPDGGLSDEELLAEYRAAELWEETAHTLLRLGRVDEAIGLAARHVTQSQSLLDFADALLESNEPQQVARALDLVDDRLWEQEGKAPHEDQLLLAWLGRQYAAHGDPTKALAMARRRFEGSPSQQTYDAVKEAALLPGQPADYWDKVRPKLIAALRKQGVDGSLIEIFLDEGDVVAAVAALEASEKKRGRPTFGFGLGGLYYAPGGLETRVAEAAEASDPDAAIRIYRRMADREIDARQRD